MDLPDSIVHIDLSKVMRDYENVHHRVHTPSTQEIINMVPDGLEVHTALIGYSGYYNYRWGMYLHGSTLTDDQLADWKYCFQASDALVDFGWWIKSIDMSELGMALRCRWQNVRAYTYPDYLSTSFQPRLFLPGVKLSVPVSRLSPDQEDLPVPTLAVA